MVDRIYPTMGAPIIRASSEGMGVSLAIVSVITEPGRDDRDHIHATHSYAMDGPLTGGRMKLMLNAAENRVHEFNHDAQAQAVAPSNLFDRLVQLRTLMEHKFTSCTSAQDKARSAVEFHTKLQTLKRRIEEEDNPKLDELFEQTANYLMTVGFGIDPQTVRTT